MAEDLGDGESVLGVESDHVFDDLLGFLGEFVWKCKFPLQNQFVQVFQVLRLEGHSPAQHGKEEDPQGPHVHEEPLVAFVDDDFRGEVGWGAALFLDDLPLLDYFGDPEVANFNSFFTV